MPHPVEGTPYHSSELHPGSCSSVGMRPRTDRQTHRQTRRHADTQTGVTSVHFASAMPHSKCNNAPYYGDGVGMDSQTAKERKWKKKSTGYDGNGIISRGADRVGLERESPGADRCAGHRAAVKCKRSN